MVDHPCERQGNNLLVYAVVFTVCLNFVNTGFIMGWPMPVLPMLLSSNSPIKLNTAEAAWIASILFLGLLSGGLVVGLKMDRYGAKRIIMISAIPSLIGWTLLGIATTYWELLLGRYILGFSMGLSYCSSEVYLSELVEARIRGLICSLCSVAIHVGLLLTFGLGTYFSLSVMAWLSLIIPLVFSWIMIWSPDTPYWYSKKKRYEEMRKALIRIRQTEHVQVEFDSINSFIDKHRSSDKQIYSWRCVKNVLSRRANRKGIFFASIIPAAQQLSGIQAINSYGQLIFKRSNHIIDERYIALFLGLIQLCCTLVCSFIIDKVGRKPLFVSSAIGSASSMLILGIYFHLESIGIDLKYVQLLPIWMVLLFAVSYGLGLSPVATVIFGELIPLDVRPIGIAIVVATFTSSAMAVTKLWQVVTDSFGVQYAFGGLAVITYINAIIVLIFLPETKGKTLAEIQRILEGRRDGRVKNKNIYPIEDIKSNIEESSMLQNGE